MYTESWKCYSDFVLSAVRQSSLRFLGSRVVALIQHCNMLMSREPINSLLLPRLTCAALVLHWMQRLIMAISPAMDTLPFKSLLMLASGFLGRVCWFNLYNSWLRDFRRSRNRPCPSDGCCRTGGWWQSIFHRRSPEQESSSGGRAFGSATRNLEFAQPIRGRRIPGKGRSLSIVRIPNSPLSPKSIPALTKI